MNSRTVWSKLSAGQTESSQLSVTFGGRSQGSHQEDRTFPTDTNGMWTLLVPSYKPPAPHMAEKRGKARKSGVFLSLVTFSCNSELDFFLISHHLFFTRPDF